MGKQGKDKNMDRRSFLRSAAAAGAGLAVSPLAFGQHVSGGTDDINVAILGTGTQGTVLMNACLNIPGVRFKAVCDIWRAYNQLRASRILQAYGHENNVYTDYQQMLAEEKDLDAVIIATPDFWHSPHTITCLEAGLHVYCEKTMSNTIEGAKAMVEASRQSNKLLQIGHQRRSNPRYIHCYEKLLKEANILNRITSVYGQWNRSMRSCEDLGWPKNALIEDYIIKEYGYDSMHQFRNWRWYKDKGSGPVVDLGSHQIDIFNWFLGTKPKSLIASGGTDYWQGRDWYDNAMVIYEYETSKGIVRALYKISTSNNNQRYYERFLGDEATLVISEYGELSNIYRQEWVDEDKWQPWIDKGYLSLHGYDMINQFQAIAQNGAIINVGETPWDLPPKYIIDVTLGAKSYHQPHLENFFDAIRGNAELNCPAEAAYKTTVTVLKINEAVAAEKKLEFQPAEFSVD